MRKLSIQELREIIPKALEKYGYTKNEIFYIAESIFYSTLHGSSQGLPKLFGWNIKRDPQAKEPEYIMVNQTIGRFNANRNNSMYVCSLATDRLISMAQSHGIGIIGVYNNNNSSGALSYYTRQLSECGLIGIMFASADPVGGIGVKGSTKGIFGSNPLSISIPYKDSDITLDMSSAKYTWGDLVKASAENAALEEGYAFDKDGNPTTSPEEAMKGSVASFDGSYKGLGLAFMIQILAGSLTGSVYAQNDTDCDYGNLIIAIDPDNFAGKEFMDKEIEKLIDTYKNSTNEEILIPGELSDRRYQEIIKAGEIEISDELYQKIQDVINSESTD